LLFI
jgi:hypothetical protein